MCQLYLLGTSRDEYFGLCGRGCYSAEREGFNWCMNCWLNFKVVSSYPYHPYLVDCLQHLFISCCLPYFPSPETQTTWLPSGKPWAQRSCPCLQPSTQPSTPEWRSTFHFTRRVAVLETFIHLSSVQNPCWLMNIGDYTTQIYPVYSGLQKSNRGIPINQLVQWYNGMTEGFWTLLICWDLCVCRYVTRMELQVETNCDMFGIQKIKLMGKRIKLANLTLIHFIPISFPRQHTPRAPVDRNSRWVLKAPIIYFKAFQILSPP